MISFRPLSIDWMSVLTTLSYLYLTVTYFHTHFWLCAAKAEIRIVNRCRDLRKAPRLTADEEFMHAYRLWVRGWWSVWYGSVDYWGLGAYYRAPIVALPWAHGQVWFYKPVDRPEDSPFWKAGRAWP